MSSGMCVMIPTIRPPRCNVSMAAVVWVSPPLRLYVDQMIDQLRQWLFDSGAGA